MFGSTLLAYVVITTSMCVVLDLSSAQIKQAITMCNLFLADTTELTIYKKYSYEKVVK